MSMRLQLDAERPCGLSPDAPGSPGSRRSGGRTTYEEAAKEESSKSSTMLGVPHNRKMLRDINNAHKLFLEVINGKSGRTGS